MPRASGGRPTAELAGEQFATKQSLADRLDEIRARNTSNHAVRLEGQDRRLVEEYGFYHLQTPEEPVTYEKITGCIVKKNPDRFNSICLWVEYVKDGVTIQKSMSSKVDHGTMKLIFNGGEKGRALAQKLKITENMRCAIEEQTVAFRNKLTVNGMIKCNFCSQQFRADASNLTHVDHSGGDDKIFDALAKRFDDEQKRKDPSFQLNDHFGRNTYSLESDVVSEWKTFHRANAVLQILCKKCHYDKSGRETSERAKRRRTE